ncbi:MAG TPA: Lon family ATP-dependent protease [Limnochordales bacterium]
MSRAHLSPQTEDRALAREVRALWDRAREIYGPERLVLMAAKVGVLTMMRSSDLRQQVTALLRVLEQQPATPGEGAEEDLGALVARAEERIADELARKRVHDEIERQVHQRMQRQQARYLEELRHQIAREQGGPDNAHTLRKYAELEQLDHRGLGTSLLAALRPQRLEDVVGQERAIRALLAKLASPMPQHVLLYGPPGVGKTTVARLVLERAKRLPFTPFSEDAPFVEVDGTTLRWDPREASNPLLGSVHDPIYQGARRDLAESGVPEPKVGLVTEAHGGVLFIDEIGELDPVLQGKLLKVLEDRRVFFESAYYDPHDPRVPRYIRKLFEEGAPADFILLGATTRSPHDINPALRSRCAEVFFDPLAPSHIRQIVQQAARRVGLDLEEQAVQLIAEHAPDGRRAIVLLADACSLALSERLGVDEQAPLPARDGSRYLDGLRVGAEHVQEALRAARLASPWRVQARSTPKVGRVLGLGAYGFRGVVLEVEAVALPARAAGQGTVRFNEAAGSMARDSVFVATSLARSLLDVDVAQMDLHVNVVGGGRIDGPSAGLAIACAVISALLDVPARQDVAVTGELSLWGDVKPVGAIVEKVWAARESGMRQVLVPADNLPEVPPELAGETVVGVHRIEEALDLVLGGPAWRARSGRASSA